MAPTHDEERSISMTRGKSTKLIVAVEQEIQKLIPGQIGRFDDAFQMLDTPTILFEAGHTPGDYQQEKTREYVFYALFLALEVIANEQVEKFYRDRYFKIPENNKLYFDIVVNDVHALNNNYGKQDSVGILFREVLEGNQINFEPYIEKSADLNGYFGHRVYNCLDKSDLEELKKDNVVYNLLV